MGISRRSALRLSGVICCSGVAGCSSYLPLNDGSSQVYINGITIVNLDTESHLFDVMIRNAKTDSVVFWERYNASAATKGEGDSDQPTTGGTYWERPVSEAGDYVLYADADRTVAENDSEWEIATLTEHSDCVGVDVGIDRDGYLYVGVKHIDSCQN